MYSTESIGLIPSLTYFSILSEYTGAFTNIIGVSISDVAILVIGENVTSNLFSDNLT